MPSFTRSTIVSTGLRVWLWMAPGEAQRLPDVPDRGWKQSDWLDTETRAVRWMAPATATLAIARPEIAEQGQALEFQAWEEPDQGWFMLNGLYQSTSSRFSGTVLNLVESESGESTTSYSVRAGSGFDGMGGVRIWENIGLGAGVSRFARTGTAAITTTVGHPFFFGRHRTVTSTADAERLETAVHLQGSAVFAVTKRVSVTVFGGPSMFQVQQDLVRDVTTAETGYPYEGVTLKQMTITQDTVSVWGVNVGADVSVFIVDRVGVGGLVRFAQATSSIPTVDRAVTVGGFQVGGGLRVRF